MFKKKFQIKSVAETVTVGEYLRNRREEAGLDLKEVSRQLGIKYEYLEGLEQGDYRSLPPQVYVRGFIRSYAAHLGLDGAQLVKIYNREQSSAAETIKKQTAPKPKFSGLGDYLTITPKLLTFSASCLVLLVLGYYFVHQINSFNSKPYLFLSSPSTDAVVKEKDLTVSGQTEKDATLEINGQEVSVASDGKFQERVTLSEGTNVLVVEAKNRFNKTERKELHIVYDAPAQTQDQLQIQEATPPAASQPAPAAGEKAAPSSVSPDAATKQPAAKSQSKTATPAVSSKSAAPASGTTAPVATQTPVTAAPDSATSDND